MQTAQLAILVLLHLEQEHSQRLKKPWRELQRWSQTFTGSFASSALVCEHFSSVRLSTTGIKK